VRGFGSALRPRTRFIGPNQAKGQVKEWWGRLSDDDIDVIAGTRDKLAGKLQERYGWARECVEQEIARRPHDGGDTDPAITRLPGKGRGG
jgi:uncharacterized protein YjbJ (UPF0337 family)